MIKAAEIIEQDLFVEIKQSDLGKAINGAVYRDEMRPDNSQKEDCIVKFVSGLDGQIQRGILVLNVYVPDIKIKSGKMVVNKTRIAELENLIISFVEQCTSTEYLYSLDATPISLAETDIQQHFIYARIAYRRITV